MLASTASTPAQGGAIIRFSGTKEAKNEVEVSYIVFASRRLREEKRQKERERRKEEKKRICSTDDDDSNHLFLSLSLPLLSGGGRMIMESIEENHYRVHR